MPFELFGLCLQMFNNLNFNQMGKNVGLIGSVSGKVGNVVYSVQNGMQTVRAYQPNVVNPKSAAQQQQRAKGNAVGRISSFVPREAIMGLGSNGRNRRGEFMKTLLNAAVVAATGTGFTAKVNVQDIIFSRGTVLPAVTLGSIAPTAGSVSVALSGVSETLMPSEEYALHATRLVAMVYQGDENRLVACSTVLAVTPAQGGSATTVVPLGVEGDYTVYIYAIPLRAKVNAAVSVQTDMVHLSDSELLAYLGVGAGSTPWGYGLSSVLGLGNFTQA